MVLTTEMERVKQALESYYRCLEQFDGPGIRALWHPEGRMYNVGNSSTFLIRSPEQLAAHMDAVGQAGSIQMRIQIKEIEHIVLHDDLIASVQVRWRMIMPDSVGIHHSYYHLVQIDGQWRIAGLVDRGQEVTG